MIRTVYLTATRPGVQCSPKACRREATIYTLANWLMAHLAGVVVAWWLIAPNSLAVNVVAAVTLVLTILWMRFVWVRRARRLASEWEDLTPNLITHGPECRWDRRSRRHDEVYGAETRGGHP